MMTIFFPVISINAEKSNIFKPVSLSTQPQGIIGLGPFVLIRKIILTTVQKCRLHLF